MENTTVSNLYKRWTISNPGAQSITLTFGDNILLPSGHRLYIGLAEKHCIR